MRDERQRALRAAAAVAFGSFVLAGCGSTPEEDPSADTGTADAGGDVTAPPDASTDTGPTDTGPADSGPIDAGGPDSTPPPPLDVGTDAPRPDVGTDAGSPDVMPDVPPMPDVSADAEADVDVTPDACLDEPDDVCPPGCTEQNDYDCCAATWFSPEEWCEYVPNGWCGCAVEGPFAPPGLRRRASWPRFPGLAGVR